MRPVVRSPDRACDAADVFVAELTRLESEVREVDQQLDRLEAEMLHALGELAQERFEEYR
jgi:hypothetical protein